jgi:hypothetical protein
MITVHSENFQPGARSEARTETAGSASASAACMGQ